MTPEECAWFILSDCKDPELRKQADAEMDAYWAEQMKDPAVKAAWEANLRKFAKLVDVEIARQVYRAFDSQEREP